MSFALLALLLCLPYLALGATYRCRFGDKVASPGETVTIEQNCAKHTCTCEPSNAACKSEMTGCLDSDTCYKLGDPARVLGARGPMQCVCQKRDDGFLFANCRTETCRDSRTNEEKKEGELVHHVIRGVTYVCTCAGVSGYKDCRTEESIKNEGKCLDIDGSYVPAGSLVTARNGAAVYQCTCAGTNHYTKCQTKSS